jgi:hypothetical protein
MHLDVLRKCEVHVRHKEPLMIVTRILRNGVHCDLVHRLYQGVVLSKCDVVLWYTHKFNFIYTHKKIIAFPAPVYIKLTNVQQ